MVEIPWLVTNQNSGIALSNNPNQFLLIICSASGLICRYLNPYIKLKLVELAIKLYQEFLNKMNCRIFSTVFLNQFFYLEETL